MPQTRAQARADADGKATKPAKKSESNAAVNKGTSSKAAKRKSPAQKSEQETPKKRPKNENPKLASLLSSPCAVLPLQDVGLSDPKSPKAETILAHVYNAIPSSTRISHGIAHETLKCLIQEGYAELETLKKSTWQERTEVLTKGAYTHYREKTATFMGELAELIEKKYDGDLNNLVSEASSSTPKIRTLLKEIKGLGDLGIDIFFDSAQSLWPCLAPFIDPRSIKTAEHIGLGSNLDRIWEDVGKEPEQMCRLTSALTTVRLEKKEGEFA